MAKCACGKHDISEEAAQAQAAHAHEQMHDAMNRASERANDSGNAVTDESCGCGGSGQGGLGLRAASAAPGAKLVDRSQGRRQLGLRGM